MKKYFIKLTQDDFPVENRTGSSGQYYWLANTIDIYANAHYVNYVTRKANYGSNLLGDGTYTGFEELTPTTSEIGYESGGRFVDETSRVDLMTWELSNIETSILDDIKFTLWTRTSQDNDPATPGSWESWTLKSSAVGQDILVIDSNQFVSFELEIETDPDADISDLTFEIYISVEIDSPAVQGYFGRTLSLLNKFPEWMDIRELENTQSATPISNMPTSLGGAFLNAVAGEWLTDLSSKIQYQQFQYYINNVDLSQKAWAYRLDNVPRHLVKIMGDGVELARCASIGEFYYTTETDDIFYWDSFQRRVYLTHKYLTLTINGEVVNEDNKNWVDAQDPYHIWNSLDDLGASVDLFRLVEEIESNDNFKKRILDVYKNKPGVGLEAFKLALRRELNLWYHMDGATPNSDYLGATPTVLEMGDLEKDPKYFNPNGTPTGRFLSLIDELAREYPVLWGFLKYDQAFWDPDGLERKGIKTLGRMYDATPVAEQYLDSGVGDGNDLYLFKPAEYTTVEEFALDLKLRGRQLTSKVEYVGLEFDVAVYGQADYEVYQNPELEAQFTIEVTIPEGVFYAHATAAATSDISADQATPSSNSYGYVDWVTPDGYTNQMYKFRKKSDNSEYLDASATPSSSQIDLSTATIVTIRTGSFNYDSGTYLNIPTQSQYKVWFDDNPSTILGSGGAAVTITKNPYTFGSTVTGNFVFQSLYTSSAGVVVDGWVSEEYDFKINLNGQLPDLTTKNQTITIPNIQWPTSSTNREIIIRLDTPGASDTYGAYSDEMSATPIFLDSSYIEAEGDNTWTNGRIKSFADSTTTITFSTTTGPLYPVDSPAWELFEATITDAVSGKIDSRGPWRNGEPGLYGSDNEVITYIDLSRDDFGIPNTTNYIVTWIGISGINNDKVICWLDSNTIKPAVEPDFEPNVNLVYSDKVVEEYLDSSTYKFSTFPIKARLSLSANQKWYPKVHSGWFYDDIEEYYLYADPISESTSDDTYILGSQNKQGAPVIVTDGGDNQLRQVHFWDIDGATPVLTLQNTELKLGNGTSTIYAAYEDIYDISVFDKTINSPVPIVSTVSESNEIYLTTTSNHNHSYEITYKVARSYVVDNDFIDGATPTAKVYFDATPAAYGYSNYVITYENSKYDPATPVPLPLNTLYTDFNEGFVYIDHDVYDLKRIEVKVNPSQLTAGVDDFGLVILEAYDIFGNPKPNVEIDLYTNFGVLDQSTVVTDIDGRAYATLDSQSWDDATPVDPSPATPALAEPIPNSFPQGLILAVSDNLSASAAFDIYRKRSEKNRILAVMDSDHVLANGISSTNVFGIVLDSNRQPVSGATVYWRKARTIYELFNALDYTINAATPGNDLFAGSVTTDSDGRFIVGPFLSSSISGYWLVACETGIGEDLVGDIVYWYEYPDVTISTDPVTNLPPYPIQHSTPSWQLENYTYGSVYPVTIDEEDFEAGESATPSINWSPPIWYAIDKYRQYHMGLSAIQGYYSNDNGGDGFDFATPIYPFYQEM